MSVSQSRSSQRGFTGAFKNSALRPVLVFLFVFLLFAIGIDARGAHAQVTLGWNASTSSNVAGYKVYYGTVSGNYAYYVDVGKTTSYALSGLSAGATYYFAVSDYDSAGDQSGYSNQVNYTVPSGTCTFAISPTTASVGASAGTGNVSVTTQTGCAWTASSAASWMSITSGGSGTGNGTVNYSVAANTATSSRTAASTIAGVSFSLTQAAAVQPPTQTYTITASAGTGGSISPSGAVSVKAGSSQSFSITPASGYAISNVVVDGASIGTVNSQTFTNVTANHTISASFTASPQGQVTTYTIYAYNNKGGTISPSGYISVNSGGSQTFTVHVRTGFSIKALIVDGVSMGPLSSYTFNNVTANHTIKASILDNATGLCE